jgi:hypothetical protein
MNRRGFFKALLGLALLPFVSKVEAAPPIIIPAPILPKPIKPRLSEDGVYKYKVTHITYTTPLHKTDKGIWMLDHWCKGHYEAVPLYPGDHLGPQSAKWVCTCTAYELMSQFIKQERDQQIINAIRG